MAPKLKFENKLKINIYCMKLIAIVLAAEINIVSSISQDRCFIPACVHFQKHNETNGVKINFDGGSKGKVTTFCYDGQQQSLIYIFANPVLRITQTENPPNDSAIFITFYGSSKSDVDFRRQQPGYRLQSLVASLRTPRQTADFSMDPFNLSCIAIETDVRYSAKINVKAIEMWYVSYLVAGVIIFFSARTCSHNVMLHYGAGVSIGLMAGVIFLLFVLIKFLPSKLRSLGYLMVVFGGSVTLWMLSSVTYLFSDPVVNTVINYWQYILAYCILTGFISFAIVYRMGGVTDERSLNLIQWLLQIIGLILIYNSTQIRDVSIVLVVITVSAYNFPRALFSHSFGKKYWNRFFPPKIKLLTEDEYITQGNIETKKALEELRDYCRSPECQSWKIFSKLKTPQRFVEFVEGSSWHVTDEELLEYDSETDMIPPHESMDQAEDNEDNESEMDFILSSP